MEDLVIYSLIGVLFGFALCYFTFRDKPDTSSDTELRREIREMNSDSTDQLRKTLESLGQSQTTHLEGVSKNIEKLKEGNEKKLDEMRVIVDEKLQETLEKRITASFEVVSKQLKDVHNGLGEMKNLADDVGGLKKVLANVSTRGAFGELQAHQIL